MQKTVKELQQDGVENLRLARDIIAKAFEGKEEDDADMDSDFSELDSAQAASDAANDDADTSDADSLGDLLLDDDDGVADEDEDDDEDGDGVTAGGDSDDSNPFAKAEGGALVDATPLLANIDARLAILEKVERRLAILAPQVVKAMNLLSTHTAVIQAQQAGIESIAKAQGGILRAPIVAKAQRAPATATVPTMTVNGKQLDVEAVYAKADALIKDPTRFGVIESHYQAGNLQGMLDTMTAAERNQVMGAETPKEG